MKKVTFHKNTELSIKNIKGFMKRRVVISGTSAKINVPKEYLGFDTYLVILENGTKKEDSRTGKNNASAGNRDNAVKKGKR